MNNTATLSKAFRNLLNERLSKRKSLQGTIMPTGIVRTILPPDNGGWKPSKEVLGEVFWVELIDR